MNIKQDMSYLHFEELIKKVDHIDGNYVECGVGDGTSLDRISRLMQGECIKQRKIFAYDSFEGIPSRTSDFDIIYGEGRCSFPLSDVQNQIKKFTNIDYTITKGWFKDTLVSYPGLPIAVLNLDVDIYPSYKECLETLYTYVQPGGLILFDEYSRPLDLIKWPGAKIAIDEFFTPLNIPIKTTSETGMSYIFKPI